MMNPLRIDGSQRNDDDAQLYKRIIRDVCYFYHDLAGYGYIMGDLDYSNDYPLPYWNLLNRIDTGCGDDRFIRSGILVLFLAMIQDQFDGSGDWISSCAEDISQNLQQFIPEDADMLRLSDTVLHGVALLQKAKQNDNRFDKDSAWAYDAFVKRYFQDCTNT